MDAAVEADPRLGNPEWTDNWTLGTGLRVEIMETATANVWLCHAALTGDQVDSLVAPDGFTKVLAGSAVADAAYFGRSPGAETDGPLDAMEIDGMRFALVARPVGRESVGEGSAVMSIDKHHTTFYRAGRTIEVLDFGDGTVAAPAWSSPTCDPDAPAPVLAPGWSIREVELEADLFAVIPNPAKVAILSNGSGFHGPLPERSVRDVSNGWA